MPPEGFALDALAQRNAALQVRLAQARRALERAKAQQKVVVSQRQEDRRDIAQQPVHKRKQPAREKTPADGDREARQLANAQKQLQYYVKEQAALSRKLARVLALGHLDTLEATVAAKEALLADARAKGRELARAHKEQARALEHGRSPRRAVAPEAAVGPRTWRRSVACAQGAERGGTRRARAHQALR